MRMGRRNLRVGLFGGTFDPVHKGHVALARAALGELTLDHVVFMPAKISPQKKPGPLAPGGCRLQMLRMALRGQRGMKVSAWEINQKGVSYTCHTLKHLKSVSPRAQWFLLLGQDSFARFHTWRRWRWLKNAARLVVGRRAGAGARPAEAAAPDALYLKRKLPAVSSTEIREALFSGQKISGLLPPLVEDYIARKGLYKR